MSKARFDLDFDQEARCMLDACDDPHCIYCQKDDGDAAFWDEFMSDPEDSADIDLEYHVQIVDEDSGKSVDFNGLNLLPYTLLRSN